MSDASHEDEDVIAAARRALTPAPEDAVRVLRATRAALAAGAAAATSAPATTTHAARLGHAAGMRLWLPRALGVLTIAGASGAIGYQLGLHESARRARAAEVASAAMEVAAAPRARPRPEVAVVQVQPFAVRGSDPKVEQGTVLRSGGRATGTTTSTSTSTSTSASTVATSASLQREIAAMRKVDRALHDRDPRRALALLAELDREVPGGKLAQERDAAFSMARCALGLGTPERLARDFAARYPGSVYLDRVQRTCVQDQRIATDPETHD